MKRKISRKTIEKVDLLEKIRIIILDHLEMENDEWRSIKQLKQEKKKEKIITDLKDLIALAEIMGVVLTVKVIESILRRSEK